MYVCPLYLEIIILSACLESDSPQYWLVHRTRVDVPSMYRPHGRYRYAYGIVSPCDMDTFYISEIFSQNWRAAAAMVVSVLPTFPGFLDSVKGYANTGAGTHLFDMAFILGVSIHLLKDLMHAYLGCSTLWHHLPTSHSQSSSRPTKPFSNMLS